MLLREFFYPSLIAASLVFAVAWTVGLIWAAISLFVHL
jgi:hypothetical protein